MNTNTDTTYPTLEEAIIYSPLLEAEQKYVLLTALGSGEITQELVTALAEFLKATLLFGDITADVVEEAIQEIDTHLENMSQIPEEDPEEIQKKADQIINIVNNFLEESKKIEGELETELEDLIHEKGEQSEIDAIRNMLSQPKQG